MEYCELCVTFVFFAVNVFSPQGTQGISQRTQRINKELLMEYCELCVTFVLFAVNFSHHKAHKEHKE
jgi:hypothetical protein